LGETLLAIKLLQAHAHALESAFIMVVDNPTNKYRMHA